jgi:hypothetical protein
MSACATIKARPVLPISQVIEASKTTSPSLVVDQIKASGTTYAARGSDFGKLQDLGVQPPVLDYIQQSFVANVDLLTRYWAQGQSLGGCANCYPNPLDLSNLASGGNGMSASGPSYASSFVRPEGIPEWIPYPPNIAFSGRKISVAQVVAQSKQGVPSAQLVNDILSSEIQDVIGVGGLTSGVGLNLTAGIPGSQFAEMRKQGVVDPVLDALQAQYLSQYIAFAKLRWQNLAPHVEP